MSNTTTLLFAAGAPMGRIKETKENRALLIERLANDMFKIVPTHRRKRMYEAVVDAVHERIPDGIFLDIGASVVSEIERKLRKEAQVIANSRDTPPRNANHKKSSNLFGGGGGMQDAILEVRNQMKGVRKQKKAAMKDIEKVGTTAPPSLMRLRQELFDTARKYTEKQTHQMMEHMQQQQQQQQYTPSAPQDMFTNNKPKPMPFSSSSSSSSAKPLSFAGPVQSTINARVDEGIGYHQQQQGSSSFPPPPPPPPTQTADEIVAVTQRNHLDNVKATAITAYNTCVARLDAAEARMRMKSRDYEFTQWETEKQIQLVPSRIPSEARSAINGAKVAEDRALLARTRAQADVEAKRLELLYARDRLDLALGIVQNERAGAAAAEWKEKERERLLAQAKQATIKNTKVGTHSNRKSSYDTKNESSSSSGTDFAMTARRTVAPPAIPPSRVFSSSSDQTSRGINPKLLEQQERYGEIASQVQQAANRLAARANAMENEASYEPAMSYSRNFQQQQGEEERARLEENTSSSSLNPDVSLLLYPVPPSAVARRPRDGRNAWQEAAIREATAARAKEMRAAEIQHESTKEAFVIVARAQLEEGGSAPDSSIVTSRPPPVPRAAPPRSYFPPPPPPPPPPPIQNNQRGQENEEMEEEEEEEYDENNEFLSAIGPPLEPAGARSNAYDARIERKMLHPPKRANNKWFAGSRVKDMMSGGEGFVSSSSSSGQDGYNDDDDETNHHDTRIRRRASSVAGSNGRRPSTSDSSLQSAAHHVDRLNEYIEKYGGDHGSTPTPHSAAARILAQKMQHKQQLDEIPLPPQQRSQTLERETEVKRATQLRAQEMEAAYRDRLRTNMRAGSTTIREKNETTAVASTTLQQDYEEDVEQGDDYYRKKKVYTGLAGKASNVPDAFQATMKNGYIGEDDAESYHPRDRQEKVEKYRRARKATETVPYSHNGDEENTYVDESYHHSGGYGATIAPFANDYVPMKSEVERQHLAAEKHTFVGNEKSVWTQNHLPLRPQSPPHPPLPTSISTNKTTSTTGMNKTVKPKHASMLNTLPSQDNVVTRKVDASTSISKPVTSSSASSLKPKKPKARIPSTQPPIAAFVPVHRPKTAKIKANEWLPQESVDPRTGVQKGFSRGGHSLSEGVDTLLHRSKHIPGFNKGGSQDHTFKRFGIIGTAPGDPIPAKPKTKVNMAPNILKHQSHLGPPNKKFDWPWPEEDGRVIKPKFSGNAEEEAYWRSMSQPKQLAKPDWARDPNGPEAQYW